tara:strand:- start:10156 stop:11007 length:852 start_codon:yes stop_codon:yes gene_type:complete
MQAMLKKFRDKLKETELDFNNSILELLNQCNIDFSFDSNSQIFNITYNYNNKKSMIVRVFSAQQYQVINESAWCTINDISSLLSLEFIEGDKFIKMRKYKNVYNYDSFVINENFNFIFLFDKLQNLSNKIYSYNKKVKFLIKKLHNQDLNNFKKTTNLLFNYITPEMVEISFKELSNKDSFELTTLDYNSYFKTAIFKIYKINRINENTFEYKVNDFGGKIVIGSNQLKNLIKKQFYFKSNIVTNFNSFFISLPFISNDKRKYTLKLEDVISKFKPYLNAEQF